MQSKVDETVVSGTMARILSAIVEVLNLGANCYTVYQNYPKFREGQAEHNHDEE